jgi:hypothetical protein
VGDGVAGAGVAASVRDAMGVTHTTSMALASWAKSIAGSRRAMRPPNARRRIKPLPRKR